MSAQDIDAWDRALRAHVAPDEREGIKTHVVDYAAMSVDPDFHSFLQSLEHVDTTSLDKNGIYAVFMNAYNAFAMKMVIDHACKHNIFGRCKGPIHSITDIGIKISGAASTVWLKPAGKINGKMYSLQQVEDFLRKPSPYTDDPRLHACIVCASISCPDVRMEAFRADSIDAQMSDQMKVMLSNPQKGFSLDRSSGTLMLSKIFSWYAADFTRSVWSVVDFILPFVPSDEDRRYLVDHRQSVKLSYFHYNWHANGDPPCNCAKSGAPTVTNVGANLSVV